MHSGAGGGAINGRDVTLVDSRLVGNSTDSLLAVGGAVYADGDVVLVDSTAARNMTFRGGSTRFSPPFLPVTSTLQSGFCTSIPSCRTTCRSCPQNA